MSGLPFILKGSWLVLPHKGLPFAGKVRERLDVVRAELTIRRAQDGFERVLPHGLLDIVADWDPGYLLDLLGLDRL